MWADQILQGIFLGGYYALIACGLSFMFGVMRIVNLAHGSIAVLSAYVVWVVAEQWHLSPFLAMLLVLPVMAFAGWLLQRTILERACARARSRRCSPRSASRS
jgi:branched-chain amino acid transport system permease protein